MDIKSLKYFVTVAEELNITRAARKLHMSQPPLSAQIKSLEEEFETELFVRGKRHLKLTESGQMLYRKAKEILNLTENTLTDVRAMGKGMRGTIYIGLVEGMAPDIAAEWFAGFIDRYPDIRFRILDGSTDDLLEKMRSGLIDLAVVTSPVDNSLLHNFYVGEERLTILMNRSHPLAMSDCEEIQLSDLDGENIIVPSRKSLIETIYVWFRKANVEPKIVCEADSYLDAAALAGRMVGVSIYPRTAYIPNDSLTSKFIAGEDKIIEYRFVWQRGHHLPRIEEEFIDYVQECIES